MKRKKTKPNVHSVLRLWPARAGPASRMGLFRATVVVVPNGDSLHSFSNKRNVKESNLPVSFIGRTVSLDRWLFSAPERMDVQEYLSLVSSVAKL